MRTIIAIPNYNMRDTLGRLLASLEAEESDHIYVLDDASRDGSADYVAGSFPAVTVVRGRANVGAAGNRNRVLRYLRGDEIVVFADADLELKSSGLARTVQGWFADDEKLGLAGGLLVNSEGRPTWWNYGWTMHPVHEARGRILELVAGMAVPGSLEHWVLRELAFSNRDTLNLEITYAEPASREVDWVSEALFAIRAGLFRKVGGFDRRFRYHSGQDLCLRVRAQDYRVQFEPGMAACHLEIDVRGDRREADLREGQFQFFRKHWRMTRAVYDMLYPPGQVNQVGQPARGP
jgi:GT2 family glycosyltransferase